jgi:hypothetical protein
MSRENDNWAGIIRAVKSPVGFFALVVLCIQAVLAIVVLQVDRTTAGGVIYVMAGLLVLVIISVLIIATRRPFNEIPETRAIPEREAQKTDEQSVLSHLSDYEVLQHKIREYADKHRSTRLMLAKGEQVIKKGDPAADLFLLSGGKSRHR